MMATLPRFLELTESGGNGLRGVAGAPASYVLHSLRMAGQEETNWCWSAVTQAVLLFLRGKALTQEEIASEHARQSGKPYVCGPPNRKKTLGGNCSDAACHGSCNDAHILRIVLKEQGCYGGLLSSDAAPSFAQIQAEIDSGRPVACRIHWSGGGGHFVLVSGWTIGADGVERVHILDPAANEGGRAIVERILPLTSFAQAYTQSGVAGRVNYSYKVR
jgi:hypothetical protein